MSNSLTNSDHDAIWEVLQNFDFGRVHDVMTYLGWLWTSNDQPRVPNINELRDAARQRCIDAIIAARKLGKEVYSSSGGLEATAEIDEDGKTWLGLKFVVTDWDNYQ
jgi:hypothetical protein